MRPGAAAERRPAVHGPQSRHPVRWLEWLVGAAAQVPPVRTVAEEWPRLDRYLAYLRISRQRRARRPGGVRPPPGLGCSLRPVW